MFPIVVLWIFLSLRYGADLRRSRLVKTDHLADFVCFKSTCLVTCNFHCHLAQSLIRFLRSEKQKDVGSSLALVQTFFNAFHFGFVRLFREFFNFPKGSIFWIFYNKRDFQKKPKSPRLTIFGTVRFFKIYTSRLGVGFLSSPARYIRIFLRPAFSICDFFSILFLTNTNKPPPFQFLLETKYFASIEDC